VKFFLKSINVRSYRMTRDFMRRINMQLSNTIPNTLANLDLMPNTAFVRLPVVAMAYGYSKATVWRNVKKGKMPKPVKLSERCTGWNVGEIKADLASKANLGV
jgi:predicted DNA-binding transcriptional regulator AlpA